MGNTIVSTVMKRVKLFAQTDLKLITSLNISKLKVYSHEYWSAAVDGTVRPRGQEVD